jgi:hypothetical protein
MRNSAVFSATDQIFTLPFTDPADKMSHNGWLYEPGNWHHAIDYSRTDIKTFQITAAAPGKVIYIGWDWWSGNTMVISHDVGTKKDAYRTIYMHLQNGPLTDCNNAWTKTVPNLSGSTLPNYKAYLNGTGCPLDVNQRSPTVANWGKQSRKLMPACWVKRWRQDRPLPGQAALDRVAVVVLMMEQQMPIHIFIFSLRIKMQQITSGIFLIPMEYILFLPVILRQLMTRSIQHAHVILLPGKIMARISNA